MIVRTAVGAAWRVFALALVASPALSPAADQHPHADVPFIPTPASVVDAMLDLARVRTQDFVIDLGSGDGRIVIAAAKKHGARGFGVEIDGALVSGARREAGRQGVADRVTFHEQNLFITELNRATVVTLYLYPRLMMQLLPRFFEELKPGARIVSHDFDMENWRPDARVTVPVPEKPYGPPSSEVYLWIVPANAAGSWRWRSPAPVVDVELSLTQTFQMLDGGASVGGRPGRLAGGRMHGDEIRFMLDVEIDGRIERQAFSGRVTGDAIAGHVNLADGAVSNWSAKRTRRGSIKFDSDR